MASPARPAVGGRYALGHVSAPVSATRSTSCPPNGWRAGRPRLRPDAPRATPCAPARASARAGGWLRGGHGAAAVALTGPARRERRTASASGAGVRRSKPGGSAVLAAPQLPATSPLLDPAQNASERQWFAMQGLHPPQGSPQAWLTGFAPRYNRIPYQRRAQHAGQCGGEVAGGTVPTRDWLLPLPILTSGGFR